MLHHSVIDNQIVDQSGSDTIIDLKQCFTYLR